ARRRTWLAWPGPSTTTTARSSKSSTFRPIERMNPATAKRPNILLIMTDQQRADHLGCYGNPILRTPNIDGLARQGVRASRFYVASPTCMSNRATLMTGRMPSLHGVLHNGIPLSREDTTFVE